tara:strand:- start:356 stop:622 length:267 start_codon:yes stop_codon:yes gene_type:complete
MSKGHEFNAVAIGRTLREDLDRMVNNSTPAEEVKIEILGIIMAEFEKVGLTDTGGQVFGIRVLHAQLLKLSPTNYQLIYGKDTKHLEV